METGGEGDYNLPLHCHHQSDSCIGMGSDESHFNLRDSHNFRQCPQTTIFGERRTDAESNRSSCVYQHNALPLGHAGSLFSISWSGWWKGDNLNFWTVQCSSRFGSRENVQESADEVQQKPQPSFSLPFCLFVFFVFFGHRICFLYSVSCIKSIGFVETDK